MSTLLNNTDLVYRLRKRSEIRKQISTRKSVQENKPDRLCELLEEAADALENIDNTIKYSVFRNNHEWYYKS